VPNVYGYINLFIYTIKGSRYYLYIYIYIYNNNNNNNNFAI